METNWFFFVVDFTTTESVSKTSVLFLQSDKSVNNFYSDTHTHKQKKKKHSNERVNVIRKPSRVRMSAYTHTHTINKDFNEVSSQAAVDGGTDTQGVCVCVCTHCTGVRHGRKGIDSRDDFFFRTLSLILCLLSRRSRAANTAATINPAAERTRARAIDAR